VRRSYFLPHCNPSIERGNRQRLIHILVDRKAALVLFSFNIPLGMAHSELVPLLLSIASYRKTMQHKAGKKLITDFALDYVTMSTW